MNFLLDQAAKFTARVLFLRLWVGVLLAQRRPAVVKP